MKNSKKTITAKIKQSYVGWIFILPSLLAFTIFFFIPIIVGVYYSMTNYTGLSKNFDFIGIQNYLKMFSDKYFIASVKNNFIYAFFYSISTLIVSLFFATVLNHIHKLKKLFRVVFFLPYISSMVSVAIIWKMIFNPVSGPLNTMLIQIGIENPPLWLASTTWALYAVIIVSVWKTSGYYMLIFLAGMQSIPDTMYESASLDGASSIQKFTRITLPLLSPTIFLNIVLIIINSFQVFDLINVMTGGGPGMSTNVLAYRIYYEAFQNTNMGYASAIAYFLFVVILAFTLIQFLIQKYWVNYD